MFNNEDIENEGFKPLKKAGTSHPEPQHLPFKPISNRSISFNAKTGEAEHSQTVWEGSSWEKMGKSRGRTMDRANSFVGKTTRGASIDEGKDLEGVVAVVDPFSTGAHLANEIRKRGFKCARVLSAWDSPVASLVMEGLGDVNFCATVQHNDRMEEQDIAIQQTVAALRDLPFRLLAVIPGAETGVELADQLSYHLGLRTNGIEQSLARRNKYIMGETVRNAGVRAVKQARCKSLEEMSKFLEDLMASNGSTRDNLRCVVKPVQSAGTDDVFLCQSVAEAETAFERIFNKVNGIGLLNDCVLVQEFLQGKEYVVDKVSRNGEHKLVSIWEYDKRKVNGANFVYFGMRLRPSTSEKAKVLIAYADKILTAVGIKHGPSHMEVMLNTRYDANGNEVYEPCLVEVGARCHGGEGTWIPVVRECIGYSQVDVTLDVYLNGTLFDEISKDVLPMKKFGRDVDMVSRYSGIVRSLPGEAFIRSLPSFRSLSWEVKPGDFAHKTIDCFTRPGCVQLVGDTEEDADRDLEAIHDLEPNGLIDYAVICPNPPSIGAVAVVDPFSTGANIAAQVLKWGYRLILIFSEVDSPVATLVSKGTKLQPTLIIQHDNANPDREAAVQQTLQALTASSLPILAIIPGSEPGVDLADRLSNSFGTRCNTDKLTEARRNKFKMQDVIRDHGIRATVQKLASTEEDVTTFVKQLQTIQGGSAFGNFKAVVKPNESAGSDSVYLCSTVEECINAFHSIHGQINGLGQINNGALCQEYLQGGEYVVDGVSRDGVYKVTAIWKYDKRSVNGANFVYFGMRLCDASEPGMKELVAYSASVVKALEIIQGPSHMEIMLNSFPTPGQPEAITYSPCLVEVGARCHDGEGSWLPIVQECIGYSQVEVTLNCYLRPDRFDELPVVPKLLKFGKEAFLVSHVTGTVLDIPGLDVIRSLSSFRRCEMMTQPGGHIRPTIDCFTRPGCVQLVNENEDELAKDYETIRQLEVKGLFELI